jgi:hypothetical protein
MARREQRLERRAHPGRYVQLLGHRRTIASARLLAADVVFAGTPGLPPVAAATAAVLPAARAAATAAAAATILVRLRM